MMVMVGLIGTAAYFNFGSGVEYSLGIGLFLPLLSLILVVMANRSILKDEKLVRSSDRLRD